VPFSPLPTILVDKLQTLARQTNTVVLDLGCGDGALGRVLASHGIQPLGMDRSDPRWLPGAHISGDALQPPFLPGQADMIIAGNLVRHLLGQDKHGHFLNGWLDLLKPGGVLVLLEDQPDPDSPAGRNLLAVHDFLVRLTEGRRGPLLSLNSFQALVKKSQLAQGWQTGLKKNHFPVDQEAVLEMLRGKGGKPSGEAARLMDSIGKHGLGYGQYWGAYREEE